MPLETPSGSGNMAMNKATNTVASTFGVIVGIAGLEHGIGEALQGNAVPGPNPIQSWPNVEAFKILGGEPAMTLLPSLLLAGFLTILVSILVIVWSIRSMKTKTGSPVLILLSVVLLLTGGGYAPPVLGVLTALCALLIHAPVGWLRTHFPLSIQNGAGAAWRWVFAVCLVLWFYLFPGSVILSFLFGLKDSRLIVPTSFLALGLMLVTFLFAFTRDMRQGQPA